MGVFNVERRVANAFVCPTPVSAAPAQRARHTVQDADLKTPHCEVEVVIGTRGTFVDRVSFGRYDGHVPDAAVMLAGTAIYAEGKSATGLCVRRVASVIAGCVLGAAFGAAVVGLGAGVLMLAHATVPTVFAAATLHGYLLAAIPAAVVAGVSGGFLDNDQWATAHKQFTALDMMDKMAARFRAGEPLVDDEGWTKSLYRRHGMGSDWALSQAAMELESARIAYVEAGAKKAA